MTPRPSVRHRWSSSGIVEDNGGTLVLFLRLSVTGTVTKRREKRAGSFNRRSHSANRENVTRMEPRGVAAVSVCCRLVYRSGYQLPEVRGQLVCSRELKCQNFLSQSSPPPRPLTSRQSWQRRSKPAIKICMYAGFMHVMNARVQLSAADLSLTFAVWIKYSPEKSRANATVRLHLHAGRSWIMHAAAPGKAGNLMRELSQKVHFKPGYNHSSLNKKWNL